MTVLQIVKIFSVVCAILKKFFPLIVNYTSPNPLFWHINALPCIAIWIELEVIENTNVWLFEMQLSTPNTGENREVTQWDIVAVFSC